VAFLLGLIPLAPYILVTAVLAAQYIAVTCYALLLLRRTSKGDKDPLMHLDFTATWCGNAPIAFLRPPKPSAGAREVEIRSPGQRSAREALGNRASELPRIVPGASREEDTPMYWETIQVMLPATGGRPDIIPPSQPRSPGN
jgi:hypothetical protein